MKAEERIKQFDTAWELIKQNDFHKKAQAVQIISKLLLLRDENACALIGRLIILNIYKHHEDAKFIHSLFYAAIYEPWLNCRNLQTEIATYTLNNALNFFITAAQQDTTLIPPLKKFANIIKKEYESDTQLNANLTTILNMETPKYYLEPTLFNNAADAPPLPAQSPRDCTCNLF